jgi:hypothetical protein
MTMAAARAKVNPTRPGIGCAAVVDTERLHVFNAAVGEAIRGCGTARSGQSGGTAATIRRRHAARHPPRPRRPGRRRATDTITGPGAAGPTADEDSRQAAYEREAFGDTLAEVPAPERSPRRPMWTTPWRCRITTTVPDNDYGG